VQFSEKNSYKRKNLNASHIIIFIYFFGMIARIFADQRLIKGRIGCWRQKKHPTLKQRNAFTILSNGSLL
jgi:hypothetical protein